MQITAPQKPIPSTKNWLVYSLVATQCLGSFTVIVVIPSWEGPWPAFPCLPMQPTTHQLSK